MHEKIEKILNSDYSIYLLLTLLLGGVYVTSLLPGVGFHGDTAKFQFIGQVLGIPHPTGYPLYLVVNYLFTSVFPFGSLAFKANLLSSVFSIGAAAVLFRLLRSLDLNKYVALSTALASGLTYTVWLQSIVAEVYSLNLFLFSLVLYYFISWHKNKLDRHFYIGCSLYALSFGNHLTMITLLPAIIYIVYTTNKKAFIDKRKILYVLLIIFLGALQYSYIIWRSAASNPGYLEQEVHDLKTLLWYVTGADFKQQMFSMPFSTVISNMVSFVILLLKEYLFLLPITIYGMFKLGKSPISIFLLAAAFSNILFSVNYDIADIFVYFIPTYFIMAVFTGYGLNYLIQRYEQFDKLLVLVPILLLIINYSSVQQRENTEYTKQVEYVLNTIGDNGLVIEPYNNYHETMYFQYYLIGEGEQKKRNIYLIPFDPERIKNYLVKGQPIYLYQQKINTPPSLSVYCMYVNQVQELEKLGFGVEEAAYGIARIYLK